MRPHAAAAWRRFRERIEQSGGRVVEPDWLGSRTPHRVVCRNGHEAAPWPADVNRGDGFCRLCLLAPTNPGSAAVHQRFREQVEARGGRVVEPEWLGTNKRHRIICGAGHEAAPRPSDVNRGWGICRTCSGCDPVAAERAFRVRLAESGAELLEPYRGNKTPVLVRCAQGHETKRTPASVRSGHGCIVCSGSDKDTTWRLFCHLIEERGGTVLEPEPPGGNVQHRVLCPEGHETLATPSYVRAGGGMCGTCSPTSTIRAERRFRELVAARGGRITEPAWLGTKVPHRLTCHMGHEVATRPNDAQQTGSICRVCAGHCSETSWREFRTRVAELGGTVTEPEWLGNKKAHRITCKEGHKTTVRPNNVDQGGGLCRYCKCKVWDIFYVVVNDAAQTVKFGVTSHDARTRLRFHELAGFGSVIRTFTSLPDAADLERAVMATLRLASVKPVRGREYYDLSVLAVILDIADNWTRDAA